MSGDQLSNRKIKLASEADSFKDRELEAFNTYKAKCPLRKNGICYNERELYACNDSAVDKCPYWYAVRVSWGWK